MNDCPDQTDAQQKKFWDDWNADCQAKTTAAEPKKGVAYSAVAAESDAAPAADDATCIAFESFQCFIAVAK